MTFGPRYPAREKDAEIISLLLQKGADINAKDRDGNTALRCAQWRGSPGIMKILKIHGAKE
jgi:ankyrin repeat protein